MRDLSLTTLLAITLACAAGGATGIAAQQADSAVRTDSAAPAKAATPAKKDPNHITADEIAAAKRPTTYDLVDRLRSNWLRKDLSTGEDPVVYMDEQNIGDANKLRDIPTVDVAELQYLPHADAVRRWGSQIKGSVIVVSRRR